MVPLIQDIFPVWWFFLFLSVSALALSIVFLIKNNSREIWYIANGYWVIVLAFFSLWFSGFLDVLGVIQFKNNFGGSLIAYVLVLAYSLLCIIYFQSKEIKKYFTLAKEAASYE